MNNRRAIRGFFGVILFTLPAYSAVFSTPDRDSNHAVKYSDSLRGQGWIRSALVKECSGITKSRSQKDVFWVHNDSNNDSRIFAVRENGLPAGAYPSSEKGVRVTNALNFDWEDVTSDDLGRLIIADTGNNIPLRSVLTLYRVDPPDPVSGEDQTRAEKMLLYFPDHLIPAYNCEAVFWAAGSIYLLTKTRGGAHTGLYTAGPFEHGKIVPLNKICSFDFDAPVTSAETSPDRRKLAVLTYKSVWLFEKSPGQENYLLGKRRVFSIHAGQCEGVCFDGDDLIIANEEGRIMEMNLSQEQSATNITLSAKHRGEPGL
jgi:hypothetical protein